MSAQINKIKFHLKRHVSQVTHKLNVIKRRTYMAHYFSYGPRKSVWLLMWVMPRCFAPYWIWMNSLNTFFQHVDYLKKMWQRKSAGIFASIKLYFVFLYKGKAQTKWALRQSSGGNVCPVLLRNYVSRICAGLNWCFSLSRWMNARYAKPLSDCDWSSK